MRYQTSILLIISLLVFTCKKTDSTKTKVNINGKTETLNGHVKEIYSYSSKYDFTRLTIDQEGRTLTSSVNTLSIAILENRTDTTITKENTTYTYNDKNGKVKSMIGETITNGSKESSKLNFDTLGRPIDDKGDTIITHNVNRYKYDKHGNLIEFIYAEWETKLEPTATRYKYDKQNRVIEETEYEPVDLLLSKKTYEYTVVDSKKNWIKAIVRYKAYPPLHFDPRTDTITRKISYY
ncbi:hypothetical protein [Mucilaginibacter sp. OK283]|jgi:hypothetical protein|uniref:hypothetical protein n=1 Tax=Mucilaginibacter sp. OK283 TaxID=1881049 RepID=UPI0008C4C2CE|nr:hypothetical protein [Mucilaginibacter sp. OK283]SEO25569.1 YD repeat-containing protein [Mucilaginibacter sp. OK283]